MNNHHNHSYANPFISSWKFATPCALYYLLSMSTFTFDLRLCDQHIGCYNTSLGLLTKVMKKQGKLIKSEVIDHIHYVWQNGKE
jgi:hypothetical protein